MSDTLIIALIIAVAVVIILIALKDRLGKFSLKANPDGINANLEARTGGVTISKSKQTGKGHDMTVTRDDVTITEHEQEGEDHKLHVNK